MLSGWSVIQKKIRAQSQAVVAEYALDVPECSANIHRILGTFTRVWFVN